MPFLFVFWMSIIFWIAFILIRWRRSNRSISTTMSDNSLRVLSFSVSDYLDRMGKLQLSLQAEKEKRTEYFITLWWGFDGLRLNEDGTAEWVSRKPTPPPQIDYSFCSSPIMYNGLQNAACNAVSAQAQIQSLQAQQLQTLQSIQIQNMINAIKPAPYPKYPTQCCITPYMPNYWTCHVNCGAIGAGNYYGGSGCEGGGGAGTPYSGGGGGTGYLGPC